MEKNEVNGLLDQMCQEISRIENSRIPNVSKDYILNLSKLVEEENILQYIIERMETEDVIHLDDVLCEILKIDGMNLTEKQMVKLAALPAKHPFYFEENIIACIIDSVEDKISHTTIEKIARSLERNTDDFFSDYLDCLWDNIFRDDITEKEKEKARKIYEETKDWFFDKGWL